MPGEDEDHVPPVVVLASAALLPAQIAAVPVMAAGVAFTVTTEVRWQVLGSV
jgi:hypothetical protein